MKLLLPLFLLLSGLPSLCQVVAHDIIPDTTGRNLGTNYQRWNGLFQNVDVSGALTCNGVPCNASNANTATHALNLPADLATQSAASPAAGTFTSVNNMSGYADTTASDSTMTGGRQYFGYQVGLNDPASGAGSLNTGMGYQALMACTGSLCNKNTAYGFQALAAVTGRANTAIGLEAMINTTTGIQNTGVGADALHANTTGNNNACLGVHCLWSNTTGQFNTSIGYDSLFSNVTGTQLVAVGDSALYTTDGTGSNTAVGFESMYADTTGDQNTAVGFMSLQNNVGSSGNTALGYFALNQQTSGGPNTAVGWGAMGQGAGSQNTAVGYQAMSTAAGTQNTAVGQSAAYGLTSGNYNDCLGYECLYNTTTSNYNTAIGQGSGATNITGANNTFLGSGADVSTSALSHATAVGSDVKATASNTVFIGRNTDAVAISSHTDAAGTITFGGATSGSYTFAVAWNSAPTCVITPTSSPGVFWWVSTTTSAVTANVASSTSLTFNYICWGNPN